MKILRSRKFQAAVVGLVVAFAGKAGLQLDDTALLTVLSPILAYIASQGLADIGKEKTIAEAAIKEMINNGDSDIG